MRAEQSLYRSGNRCYRFGDFTIDGSKFCLYRGGFHQALGRRAFELLFYLIENRERVVGKKELLKNVWRAVVSDEAVRREINEIRHALGDSATKPQYIETIRGRGYRFIAVAELADDTGHIATTSAVSPQQRDHSLSPLVWIGLNALAFAVFIFSRTNVPAPGSLDVFDQLLNAYNLRHQVLTQNHYLQAFLIAAGIVLLVACRENKNPLPGLPAPVSALHFIFAPVLFYLWIEFGFALDDLIKYRVEAWKLLSAIGDPHSGDLMRKAMLFNDSGFMDGWFMCFRPAEHAIRTNFLRGSTFFFTLIFGTLFSLNHAYIFIGLRQAAQHFFPKSDLRRPKLQKFVRSLPWICMGILALSHLQFAFGGNEPNWLQPLMIPGTVAFSYILYRVSRPAETN
jgi:DNA-binding winged helix-turn-helix (wHTH) protein